MTYNETHSLDIILDNCFYVSPIHYSLYDRAWCLTHAQCVVAAKGVLSFAIPQVDFENVTR